MSKVYIIGFERDYEKKEINCLIKHNVINVSLKPISRFYLSKISRFKIPFYFILNFLLFYYQKIKMPTHNDIVIVKDDLLYLDYTLTLNGRKKLILRNIVNERIEKYIHQYQTYTFDKADAKKYTLISYPQYTSGHSEILSNSYPNDYDFSFVGIAKGRSVILSKLKLLLEDEYKVNILLINSGGWKNKILPGLGYKSTSLMSYSLYLTKQLNAKVVLDIVQDGQTGESMRFLEAMLAKKKLLTNNEFIINHPLYSPKNVLIINSLEGFNANIIRDFLSLEPDFSYFQYINKFDPMYILSKIIYEGVDNAN